MLENIIHASPQTPEQSAKKSANGGYAACVHKRATSPGGFIASVMPIAELTREITKTVEALANVQPAEPKAHVYVLKTPVHKKLGLMRAGFSQTAR